MMRKKERNLNVPRWYIYALFWSFYFAIPLTMTYVSDRCESETSANTLEYGRVQNIYHISVSIRWPVDNIKTRWKGDALICILCLVAVSIVSIPVRHQRQRNLEMQDIKKLFVYTCILLMKSMKTSFIQVCMLALHCE